MNSEVPLTILEMSVAWPVSHHLDVIVKSCKDDANLAKIITDRKIAAKHMIEARTKPQEYTNVFIWTGHDLARHFQDIGLYVVDEDHDLKAFELYFSTLVNRLINEGYISAEAEEVA